MIYRLLCITLTLAVIPVLPFLQTALTAQEMTGLEVVTRQAQSAVSTVNLRNMLRTLTEEPHVAGTPADLKTAEYVRDKLKSWGWSAELVEYEVLLNYPVTGNDTLGRRNPILEITRPNPMPLAVTEAVWPGDKDSASPDAFAAFHGYGVSGLAEGQVIYANYGRPEDFETLAGMGVEVRDRIVLVRYGKLFRGLKVREAQKRGARGVLIYSDPADDGFAKGDVYPAGPYRPASAIQRGSVQFLSLGPGDPTTPGRPSIAGVPRLPFDPINGFTLDPLLIPDWEKVSGHRRTDYFAAIPSLPISYEAAKPIFDTLAGQNVPESWQGGLPLPYHTGPGPSEVRFSIKMDYAIRKIWNVVARLEGNEEPNRVIMIGNHRDAWTYGAVDPSSGSAATMEACRVLGDAYKKGWRPRRSLVYASWDGEEYGLVGSTEYAEQFGPKLQQNVCLMLNVDSAVGGTSLEMSGIPSIRDLLLESAATVTDPRSNKTLRDMWLAKSKAAWAADEPVILDDSLWKNAAQTKSSQRDDGGRFSPKLGDLGSGSDYTAYVDHLGIPAADVDFGGRYGVYHSIYDNFFWMEKFGDPEFVQHATAARLYTAVIAKSSSEPVLPLTFTPYAEAIRGYLDELRTTVVRRRRTLEDPKKLAFEIPRIRELAAAILKFEAAAKATDAATNRLKATSEAQTAEKLEKVNALLTAFERTWLNPAGLPGRPWYRHVIYAPGLTTGYASWPLPGLRQAIYEFNQPMADEQTNVLISRIQLATQALEQITAQAKLAR